VADPHVSVPLLQPEFNRTSPGAQWSAAGIEVVLKQRRANKAEQRRRYHRVNMRYHDHTANQLQPSQNIRVPPVYLRTPTPSFTEDPVHPQLGSS
jgi:hypothetical protein